MASELGKLITTELMREAMETWCDVCDDNCIHAKSMIKNKELLDEDIMEVVVQSVLEKLPPDLIFARIWYLGLHVGYRLRQLQEIK